MKQTNQGFGTLAIHGGQVKDKSYGALTVPIYQSSTFVFDDCAQGGRRFSGAEGGFVYTRIGNPTTAMLENKLAALEGAEAAAATASGMGAISAVFWTVCKAGAHVIADSTLYGCTYALLSHGLTRFGVEVSFIDTSDMAQVKAALRNNTVAIYLETPANPNLKIIDLRQVCDIAHTFNKNIRVICDNTFATPYLQKPLALGCDIVVHSATKYINGHGDVIAGVALGSADFINELKLFGVKDMTGSVISPHDAYLVLRGLKTLELRMERHCANAKLTAEYLASHSKVAKVYYPGIETHPGHAIAKEQMKGFGGMISFEIQGGKEAGIRFLNNLELCALAVSLGDAETLVEHPASMTHSTYTADELKKAGVPEGLVRISVGLENPQDIIADLEHGFSKI